MIEVRSVRNTAQRFGPVTPSHDQIVMVACWCETAYAWLPLREVRAGLTGSCGLYECHLPHRKVRRHDGKP